MRRRPELLSALRLLRHCSRLFASHVSAGYDGTCALRRSGKVFCWGASPVDRLPQTVHLSPVAIDGVDDATALASSGTVEIGHCVTRKTGAVACWGSIPYGAGYEPKGMYNGIATIAGVAGLTQLSTGFATCGAAASGEAVCFSGEPDHETIARMPGVHDATAVVGLGAAWCAVRRSGTVTCEAWQAAGKTQDVPELAGAVHVSSRGCFALRTGAIECLDEADWQLGRGPKSVTGISDARLVDGSRWTGCAVRTNGHISCWGDNNVGQLGDGTHDPRSVPVEVVGVSDAIAISVGQAHACAVRKNGRVACWGSAFDGRLGTGDDVSDSVTSPVRVDAGI